MATAETAHRRPHVLVFPYPALGHLLPLVDLAHHLSLRFHLNVTVVTTPKNLPSISHLLSPTFQALTLTFPSHPSIPPDVENIRHLGPFGNHLMISALTRLSPRISLWFRSHPDPPIALISDFFLGWTTALARDLGIPRLTFFCSGAFLAAVSDRCWTHLDPLKKLNAAKFPDLPGSPSFRWEHLPQIFRAYKPDPDWDVVKESMLVNISSAFGCIFNSLESIEGKYLTYIKKMVRHDRVYAVGPISLLGSTRSEPDPDPASTHVFEWLDECPVGSVLYVCFGSQRVLSQEQAEALAEGLERSGTRFVWASARTAPAGFEERVGKKGLVMRGWAPQGRILGHGAVGGFLSHCGWNSVLEGLAGGVALLAWPMGADQHVNARLIVEELRVGTMAGEGPDSVPDPGELAGVIGEWAGTSGETWKARALELRDEALGAVGEGGGSRADLDRLGVDLLRLPRVDG